MNNQHPSRPQIRMIIIGDWVIDENWIVAEHRSDVSSNAGDAHYRSLITDLDAHVLGLCGAGYVAKLLHPFSHENLSPEISKFRTSIYGVGLWSEIDTKALASLLCKHHLANQTPGTLTGVSHRQFQGEEAGEETGKETGKEAEIVDFETLKPLCAMDQWMKCQRQAIQQDLEQEAKRFSQVMSDNENKLAYELNAIVERLKPDSTPDCKNQFECCRLLNLNEKSTTTRVLRTYGLTGKRDPQLLYRFDWENREATINPDRLKAALKHLQSTGEDQQDVAIVALDLGKGSISDELIEGLQENYRTARWFIRVKKPDDLKKYKTVLPFTRLLLFGPEYVKKNMSPIHRWPAGARPDDEMIEQLKAHESLGLELSGTSWVVAHHHDNRALALLKIGTDTKVLAVMDNPKPWTVRAGRTTYLFSALIAQILDIQIYKKYLGEGDATKDCLEVGILEAALEKTQDQIYLATKGVKTFLDATTDNPQITRHSSYLLPLADSPRAEKVRLSERRFQVRSFGVLEIQNAWEAARDPKGLGVITSGKAKSFDIWRGMSSVNGCIALDKKKRRDLTELLDACSRFRENTYPTKSLCCMIIGNPGVGKSYIVERIAEQLEMEPLMYNITHLSSNEELLDCFDDIASRQAARLSRRFLIFFDEINATLAREEVWGRFLAPISSGVFRRGGRLFQLRPAAWIFAGTGKPGEDQEHKRKDKASDFLSRINGPIVELSTGAIQLIEPQHGTGQPFEETQSPDEYMAMVCKGEDKFLRLEQVYLGMILSRRRYKDLIVTHRKVLEFFFLLIPKFGSRSIEYVIDTFTNIQHGELTCDNLPEQWSSIDLWCHFVRKGWSEKNSEEAYRRWLEVAKQKKDTEASIRVYESPR